MSNKSIAFFSAFTAAFSLISGSASADSLGGPTPFAVNVQKLLADSGIGIDIPAKLISAKAATFQPTINQSKEASANQTEVIGLIVRYTDPEAKRRSKENRPPPQRLIDDVISISDGRLSYGRAMSLDSFVFRFNSPLSWKDSQPIVERLKTQIEIEFVDLDIRSTQSLAPNDAYANYQWNLQLPSSFPGSANLGQAWNITQGSNSTIVAVVDSGVTAHPEYAARLLPGFDFISDPTRSNDGTGRDSDPNDSGSWSRAGECGLSSAQNSSWHGTHVTGIIAASGNNSQGIAGVNWNTRILPVRVLGKCGGAISDIIDGMLWAAGISVPGVPNNQYPAKVINMSLGGASPNGCAGSTFQDAINRIKATGSLIVVAAGNDDREAAYYIPASCIGVMTVASVGPAGERASYSNYSTRYSVDVSAPGGDSIYGGEYTILSTYNSGLTTPQNPGYAYMQGTSMAAPHVSGIASLALAIDPQIPSELLQLSILLSARSFPANSPCTTYYPLCGFGITDAAGALAAVNALKPYLMVYEFKNTNVDHYFRTSSSIENANVLNGSAGPGWVDTKDYYMAWRDSSQGASPVCRFYGAKFQSHFYTANQSECAEVKRNPDWSYEGIVYYAKLPINGACPAGTTPVYRAYNNRPDANHRFSTQMSVMRELTAQKWIFEGIAMCGA
jgi:serine protease